MRLFAATRPGFDLDSLVNQVPGGVARYIQQHGLYRGPAGGDPPGAPPPGQDAQ